MAEAEEQRVHRREFSYDVTVFKKDTSLTRWCVMEKGSEQSQLSQQYELSFEIINEAKDRIYHHFPNIKEEFSESPIYRKLGYTIYLKKEYDPLLSVKARGVIYTLLKLPKERYNTGVVTVSTGSFAYILCHYGNILNIKVTVVMPTTIAGEYVQKCRDTGIRANVVLHSNNMIEAHKYAVNLARNDGLFYLDGNDHPYMIIGQATLGIEILEEMPGVEVVILPTLFNDCGLTAGIATAIKDIKSDITTIEAVPLYYDIFIDDIRRQTTLYNEPDFSSTTYQWSNPERETLFNTYRSVYSTSISGAKRTLQRIEGIDDFCTSLGLGWIKSAEQNEKRFIKGKRIVIFSFGKMDSYMDYIRCTLYTKSQPVVPGAGPSTSHLAVPHDEIIDIIGNSSENSRASILLKFCK